eukprot:761957-Hanusia_phi.AAC.1
MSAEEEMMMMMENRMRWRTGNDDRGFRMCCATPWTMKSLERFCSSRTNSRLITKSKRVFLAQGDDQTSARFEHFLMMPRLY